jgi:hypothetical protein
MHRRSVRVAVVILLLAAGAGAGLATRDLHRRLKALTSGGQDVTRHIDAMNAAAADIASAPEADASRAAAHAQQIDGDAAAVRPQLRSVDAAAHLQALAEETAALRTDAMRATLTQLAAAETAAIGAERGAILQQMWTVIGALAVAWVLGLLVMARVPKTPAPAAHPPAPSINPMMMTSATELHAPRPDAESAAGTVDLAAAADLCTAIARVTSAAALPDILARAASVLDASGIVLWMGAGQELFAANAYGYDPAVIARLGRISRSADNATAAAWRTGEMRTVSGDMMTHGAVVAPLLGPDNCIGVLAAEIRHGREDDSATRAVTTMIAAQLATIVAAWPGASRDDSAEREERAAPLRALPPSP